MILHARFMFTFFLASLCAISAAAQEITVASGDYDGWRALRSDSPKPTTEVFFKASWRMPDKIDGKLPAVVLMPGASGVVGGEMNLTRSLTQAGYAVLVAYRHQRGTNSREAEKIWNTTFDAFNLLKAAAADPRINTSSIAIAGISAGGVSVLGSNIEQVRKKIIDSDLKYAAHVGFYPNCKFTAVGDNATTGAPMLLIVGGGDTNAPPRMCEDIVRVHASSGVPSRIKVSLIPNAPHAFLNSDDTRIRFDSGKANWSNCPVNVIVYPGGTGLFRNGNIDLLEPAVISGVNQSCTTAGSRMGYDHNAADLAIREAVAFLRETMPTN